MGIESMISYGAVVGAAVAAYVLGMLWHGPVFGKTWMKLAGITKKSKMNLTPVQAMTAVGLVQLLVAYVLAHFVKYVQVTTVAGGIQLAFWIWLGFSAPLLFGGYLWENKSLKLFCFNAVYRLAELSLMAVILARWG